MTADDATGLTVTPASVGPDTRLPALRAFFRRVRARKRLGAVLRSAVWSLLAGLVALCVLEGAAAVLGGAAPAAPVAALEFSIAIFASALALASLVVVLGAPDNATLARAVDREFSLQERLSTALEVDTGLPHGTALDPVRSALLAETEQRASAIDPRQVVRLSLPRAAWAVPVLIAAAVLLQLVPPGAFGFADPRGVISGADRNGGGLTGQQSADAAANLRRIAELIGKDAEAQSDPYLRTIARTLDRLSADVGRATVDRRVLAAELDRLLQHTRQAYARGERQGDLDRGAARQDPAEMLKSALDDIAGNRQAGATTPQDSAAPGTKPDARVAARDRTVQPSERKAVGGQAPAETATSSRLPAGWADILKNLDDYDLAELDPRSQIERTFAEQQRRERARGQPAGAAQDAGQGEGDQAGDGTRPLGNGDLAAPADGVAGGDMVLPDQAGNDGRRIRIEIPPDAVRSNVAPPPSGSAGDWRRVHEQSVARPALTADDRKVVGRYFLRSAEGRAP